MASIRSAYFYGAAYGWIFEQIKRKVNFFLRILELKEIIWKTFLYFLHECFKNVLLFVGYQNTTILNSEVYCSYTTPTQTAFHFFPRNNK